MTLKHFAAPSVITGSDEDIFAMLRQKNINELAVMRKNVHNQSQLRKIQVPEIEIEGKLYDEHEYKILVWSPDSDVAKVVIAAGNKLIPNAHIVQIYFEGKCLITPVLLEDDDKLNYCGEAVELKEFEQVLVKLVLNASNRMMPFMVRHICYDAAGIMGYENFFYVLD